MKNYSCFCTLCKEPVTVPYWHEGKPYGYTCITKVNPKAKRIKSSKAEYAPCKITWQVSENNTLQALVSIGGRVFTFKAGNLRYIENSDIPREVAVKGNFKEHFNVECEGYLMVKDHGGNKLWKRI